MWLLIRPRRDHDVPGMKLAARGRPKEEAAVVARVQRGDIDPLAHGRSDDFGVSDEMLDDLVSSHEPVRVITLVLEAGQLNGPVGRHETEAVPACVPRPADPAALQDHVIDPGSRQLVAQGEPGLPGSDHRDIEMVLHPRAPPMYPTC
jgi:hypothetical protein